MEESLTCVLPSGWLLHYFSIPERCAGDEVHVRISSKNTNKNTQTNYDFQHKAYKLVRLTSVICIYCMFTVQWPKAVGNMSNKAH